MSRISREAAEANQQAFLGAYAITGSVKRSAEAINMPKATVYTWLRADLYGFRLRYEEAKDDFREYLQDIAIDRVKGQKPGDNPVLLITLLNAHWPERYRRDAGQSDNAAKEMMAEWKRWVKDTGKGGKGKAPEGEPAPRDAVAEAQKIIARKSNGNNGSSG
tara:strand:- start:1552 stop:2037 length:486 start_codon:yes stop_codon:yes gene_type:complete